jgi:glutamine amidotransferase
MQSESIVVIDYGMGNLGSIANMLKYLGANAVISANKSLIDKADKLILPGVGHFDRAMQNIHQLDLFNLIQYKALDQQTPIMGICLGMQLLCNSSEEGIYKGLAFVDADVVKFNFEKSQNLKVPHMGWNKVENAKPNSLITKGLTEEARFYFVHSYYVTCKNESDILTRSQYGHSFVSSFEKNNVVGVQFHPEKSHKFGITLFRNFIENF